MIYLISNSKGQVKIGWSKHPQKRLKELQTGNASKLRLEAVYDLYNKYELRLHYILRDFKSRHKGEWFDVSVEDAKSIINEVGK